MQQRMVVAGKARRCMISSTAAWHSCSLISGYDCGGLKRRKLWHSFHGERVDCGRRGIFLWPLCNHVMMCAVDSGVQCGMLP